MRKITLIPIIWIAASLLFITGCQPSFEKTSHKKTIIVTYSVLGSLVKDLAGDQAIVQVLIPNGQDPHGWEPSARDIEALTKADLVVMNGLGLEGGLERSLAQAKQDGVKFFTASEHITIRRVGIGEGIPGKDPDQAAGAQDPHLWMDPLTMKSVMQALAEQIKNDLAIDLSVRSQDITDRLDSLNSEISQQVDVIPSTERELVTGHESLGYFAQRYGFRVIGAIIPSLTSQAEVSAADLAALKTKIQASQVKVVFAELGTPQTIVEVIGKEAGVKIIPLATHVIPQDGSYFTFMRTLSQTILTGMNQESITPTYQNNPVVFMVTPFLSNQFMLNALAAGVLVSIACGIVGTLIVLRGLAFIGDALAHGVLPGIAVALLLGLPGILGAALGAVVMIGGISLITQRSRLSSDTAIGLLFVGMLALGVVIVSRSTSFSGDLIRVLFGEVLGIDRNALLIQLTATLLILITTIICARPFLMLCFNTEQAQVAGYSVKLYHNLMLALIALTVIVSFQTVGTLLVFGMLLAPAGASALVARRMETMMIWSGIFGTLSVYIGLLSSYYFNIAAGASIVLSAAIIFFIVFLIQNLRAKHMDSTELLKP